MDTKINWDEMTTIIIKDDAEDVALYNFLKRKHVKNKADKFLFDLWWSEQTKKKYRGDNDEAGHR